MSIRIASDYTELTFHYMRLEGQVETLLEFLLRRFRYLDDQEWRKSIKAQRVWVDGKLGHSNLKLRSNQKIVYLRPDYLEPEIDPHFEVIFEDDALIAMSKSGNLPTSPSGKYYKNTLVNLIKSRFGWKKLYTIHRLDRETSGVIVFAKRHDIAQTMAAHFRNKQINKIYSAVLSNHLPDNPEQKVPEIYLSLPIGQDVKSQIRIKQSVTPLGKTAQTHFKEIKRLGNYSMVEVRTFTGRTHQIRVHAAHLGCPILGDKLYGLPNDGFLNWLNEGDDYLLAQNFPLHRHLLHALEINFPHPVTNEKTIIRTNDNNLVSELKP